jgi:hypothetical protein
MVEREHSMGEQSPEERAVHPTDNEAEQMFAEGRGSVPGDGTVIPDQRRHHSGSPVLSGGDVDAAWDRIDTGEEAVGGTAPTPDQDIVEEIGEAAGVLYEDGEPLHTTDKLEERDRHRWELDPASSEDYSERLADSGRFEEPERGSEAR